MMETKIQLSAAEMELMCNADVILTKNKVLAKTAQLLEAAQEQMQSSVASNPLLKESGLFTVPPKISRGENYRGLPYLILDYPRVFQQHDTFAIRTFFWWGHFFSSTWHLSGTYKNAAQNKIEKGHPLLAPQHYLCINPDPWQHHFEEDNYVAIAHLGEESFRRQLAAHHHIKIAAKYPLNGWPFAATTLFENWKFFLQLYFS